MIIYHITWHDDWDCEVWTSDIQVADSYRNLPNFKIEEYNATPTGRKANSPALTWNWEEE